MDALFQQSHLLVIFGLVELGRNRRQLLLQFFLLLAQKLNLYSFFALRR
jgi:hypothetical protein